MAVGLVAQHALDDLRQTLEAILEDVVSRAPLDAFDGR